MKSQDSIEKSTLDLARKLLVRESITPDDNGCQKLIAERLTNAGFVCSDLSYNNVSNLWAKHGNTEPLLIFAGHTDVVPAGAIENWKYPPFSATVIDGMLYGRGSADMKGSLAAIITSCERFLAAYPDHRGSLGILITSDEEGRAVDGTAYALKQLQHETASKTFCVVGEPTSTQTVGDTIKNGRRGSVSGVLTVYGIQGHVAYPHLALNPIHECGRLLDKLAQFEWDNGDGNFPATTFQVSNIAGGTGATNVIPASVEILFNLRFSPSSPIEYLRTMMNKICEGTVENFSIKWHTASSPYLTANGELIQSTIEAIKSVTNSSANITTDGGTSDGRFFAEAGAQVVELGPVNRSIHKINECVSVAELAKLSIVYERMIEKILE
ncbi:MAG: succinyl-diaminopimelate desuccinylase [Acidiferrobacteraceae bacterium]|nr:succinyl-diaminopimelate desuccinylase [Acidiferrobacteraceae bacterium]